MKKKHFKIFKTNKFYKDKNGKFKTIYRHKYLSDFGITGRKSYNIYRISKNPKSKIYYGIHYTKKDINKEKKTKKKLRISKKKKMKGGEGVATRGSGSKIIKTKTPPKIDVGDGSPPEPKFIGAPTEFNGGDHIECVYCKYLFKYEGGRIPVVACPKCKSLLTNRRNNTEGSIYECEIISRPWDCRQAFWKYLRPHDQGKHEDWERLATGTFETRHSPSATGKFIPPYFQNRNHYFKNNRTGETSWDFPSMMED